MLKKEKTAKMNKSNTYSKHTYKYSFTRIKFKIFFKKLLPVF